VNPAVVAPAATVTFAGTVAFALSLDSATTNPPAGAASLTVTVQAEVPGAFTLAGAQLTPLNVSTAFRLTVAVRLRPPKLAVTVADASVLTVPAVAVNVPLLDPLLTVAFAGTVNTPVLLVRLTVAVLVAAFVSVTVQVEVWPVPSVPGLQLRLDSCAGATRLNEEVRVTPLALAVTTAV
jgi:hypothetical protein